MRLSRIKSIRARCLDCSDGYKDVKECWAKDCDLYPYRMGHKAKDYITPAKAIRKYCLWCSNNQPKEIRLCPSKDCSLYRYRLGYEIETEALK